MEYNEITDQQVKEQFDLAKEIVFSARPFNCVPYRSISFGNIGWWLPLEWVLPIIGITPQMLRPVFSPQRREVVVKRRFPFNLIGNRFRFKIVEVELPLTVNNYEELGGFPLSEKPFLKLARIFRKPVKVCREVAGTGAHLPLFIAHPSGEIVEVKKT